MNRISHESRILFFTSLGHGLTHAYMILFMPVLDEIGLDFRLRLAGITAYVTIANLCYGVGAVPAGWLGDRTRSATP